MIGNPGLRGRFWLGPLAVVFVLSPRDEAEGGGDEGEKKRLDDFAKWLLSEGD